MCGECLHWRCVIPRSRSMTGSVSSGYRSISRGFFLKRRHISIIRTGAELGVQGDFNGRIAGLMKICKKDQDNDLSWSFCVVFQSVIPIPVTVWSIQIRSQPLQFLFLFCKTGSQPLEMPGSRLRHFHRIRTALLYGLQLQRY